MPRGFVLLFEITLDVCKIEGLLWIIVGMTLFLSPTRLRSTNFGIFLEGV